MSPQNLNTLRVKRTDDGLGRLGLFLCDAPWTTGPAFAPLIRGNQFTDPALHFAGSFVGERDRQNPVRRDAIADQVGDAKRHDSRFSSPCAGQYQHRTTQGGYRFGLWPIQSMICCVQSVLFWLAGCGDHLISEVLSDIVPVNYRVGCASR